MTEARTPATVPRVGFLYPDSGGEGDYQRIANGLTTPVETHVVNLPVRENSHREEALLEIGSRENLLAGAGRLPQGLGAAMWACTSASFIFGLEGARQQVAPLRELLGVPVSSSSLAFVAALEELGVKRVTIAATYPEGITAHFRRFLTDAGFEVLSEGSLGIISGDEVSELDADAVVRLVLANDHPDAQAIVVPDTALNSVESVEQLEREIGKPVLTSNQVTAWQGLRLAGHSARGEGLGVLFHRARTSEPAKEQV